MDTQKVETRAAYLERRHLELADDNGRLRYHLSAMIRIAESRGDLDHFDAVALEQAREALS